MVERPGLPKPNASATRVFIDELDTVAFLTNDDTVGFVPCLKSGTRQRIRLFIVSIFHC